MIAWEMMAHGVALVMVIKKILSLPWYLKAVILSLLVGVALILLVGANLVTRKMIFTEVLSAETTESIFYKMKKADQLNKVKGQIQGISVGRGVFDKGKKKTFFPVVIYARDGKFEATLYFDSSADQQYGNPVVFLPYTTARMIHLND